MAKLILDLWKVLKRHRRTLMRLVLTAAVFIVIAAAAFVTASESPRFCVSCHIMEPYYNAWASSKHNTVKCLECHYPPTVGGHVKSKFIAISQVVQYFTGTYGTRFWAEIGDEACLQKGCHDTRLLTGRVTFKKDIAFDHAFHLGDMRRGKKLRCTSCHSQIVVGNHIEVTETTCFICHFKDAKLGAGTADCLICHGPPKKPVKYKGLTFDHTQYLQRNVPCTKCHIHVVQGNGDVPPARCYSCHADRSNEVTEPVQLHRIHVTDHKVDCLECHLEIRHGTLDMSPLLAPNCSSCHGDMHSTQEEFYIGTGGLDTPDVPGAMFASGVSCAGCHNAPTHGAPVGTSESGAFPRASSDECAACHGVVYKKTLQRWQQETKKSYEKASGLVAQAKAAVYATGADDPKRAYPRTLISQAEKNLELVARDGSYGAHNIIYTNGLIETAALKADKAAEKVGARIPFAPAKFRIPAEKDTCAWRCHFGVERTPINVNGKTFDHGKHLFDYKLKCTDCHDAEKHGYTLPATYNCAGCHHVKGKADCSSCHGDARALTVSYKGRTFAHRPHLTTAKLKCDNCHAAASPATVAVDCAACHHKDKSKKCATCHNGEAAMLAGTGAPAGPGEPSPMAKLGCRACHGQPPLRPDAATCTKCHPAGYAAILKGWQNNTSKKSGELENKLAAAAAAKDALAGLFVGDVDGATLYKRAAADLRWARGDGSRGVHNNKYTNDVLKTDIDALDDLLSQFRNQ